MNNKKQGYITLRIEEDYIKQLQEKAEAQERSLSFIVRKIIIKELEK